MVCLFTGEGGQAKSKQISGPFIVSNLCTFRRKERVMKFRLRT